MQKLLSLVAAGVSLATVILGAAAPAAAQTGSEAKTLNVLTYAEMKSYGVTPELEKLFQAQCHCQVNFSFAERQSLMLNQYLLEAKKAKYDVILGVNLDQAQLAQTKHQAFFSQLGVPTFTNFAYKWDNPYATPISSSAVTAIYANPNSTPTSPKYESFKAWLEQDKASLTLGDPRSNDVGRAVNRLIAYYYPTYQQQLQAWKLLKPRVKLVGKGWSAYYGAFTKGESEATVGYSSSLIYHHLVEGKKNFTTATFAAGHPYLVDSVLVAANAKQPELAKDFVTFLLTPAAQKVLFLYNSSYPVNQLTDVTPEQAALAHSGASYPVLDLRNLEQATLDSSLKAYLEVFGK